MEITGRTGTRMVASSATMSDRMEMVSMTRYSCLSGFHGAVSVEISSSIDTDTIEGWFLCSVGVAMSNR